MVDAVCDPPIATARGAKERMTKRRSETDVVDDAAGEDAGPDDRITQVTFPDGTATEFSLDRPLAFRVTIHYREPEFESRAGRRAEPFRWTYCIAAHDRRQASDTAIREFHATARLSSVSWRRDIVSVVAEPAPTDDDRPEKAEADAP
jgi:hypothetical protein